MKAVKAYILIFQGIDAGLGKSKGPWFGVNAAILGDLIKAYTSPLH